MRENNLPGVVVSIVVPGEGEYVAVKGKVNLETGRARAVEDPLRVASITKTFTASVILQLVDDGKLRKSDKLSQWFPNFPNADQITVDDLLHMRGGIADSADAELLQQYYDDPLMRFDANDSIKRVAGKASQFEPPNQKTKYVSEEGGVRARRGCGSRLSDGCTNGWYGCTGGTPEYHTAAYYLPSTDATMIVVVNSQLYGASSKLVYNLSRRCQDAQAVLSTDVRATVATLVILRPRSVILKMAGVERVQVRRWLWCAGEFGPAQKPCNKHWLASGCLPWRRALARRGGIRRVAWHIGGSCLISARHRSSWPRH